MVTSSSLEISSGVRHVRGSMDLDGDVADRPPIVRAGAAKSKEDVCSVVERGSRGVSGGTCADDHLV